MSDHGHIMGDGERAWYGNRFQPPLSGDYWNSVDALMLRTLAAAEKVAKYRHAQIAAVRLSGDINMKPENVNLDELLASIRADWAVLGPLIEMGPGTAPQGSRTEGGLTVGGRRIERHQRSGA
jgi:hypothetical protein